MLALVNINIEKIKKPQIQIEFQENHYRIYAKIPKFRRKKHIKAFEQKLSSLKINKVLGVNVNLLKDEFLNFKEGNSLYFRCQPILLEKALKENKGKKVFINSKAVRPYLTKLLEISLKYAKSIFISPFLGDEELINSLLFEYGLSVLVCAEAPENALKVPLNFDVKIPKEYSPFFTEEIAPEKFAQILFETTGNENILNWCIFKPL